MPVPARAVSLASRARRLRGAVGCRLLRLEPASRRDGPSHKSDGLPVSHYISNSLSLYKVVIPRGVEDKCVLAVALGREVGPDSLLLGLIVSRVAVISLVRQQGFAEFHVGQQLLGCGAVMGLTRCQSNAGCRWRVPRRSRRPLRSS